MLFILFLYFMCFYSGWIGRGNNRLYLERGKILKEIWIKQDSKYLHLDNEGHIQRGIINVSDNIYYFNEETGFMETGWINYKGKKLYCGKDGKAVTGKVCIDKTYYIFDDSGFLKTGWINYDNAVYYQKNTGIVYDWNNIDGVNYYFNLDGSLHTGWLNINNDTFYFQSDGKPVIGKQTIENKQYFFLEDGRLYEGWSEDNKTYYTKNGALTGPSSIENEFYFFDSNGFIKTGLVEINNQKYYFTDNGKAQKGWHETKEGTVFTCEDGFVLDIEKEQGNAGRLVIRKNNIDVRLFKSNNREDYQNITDNYNSALVVKERRDTEEVIADRKSQGFVLDGIKEGDYAYLIKDDEIIEYTCSRKTMGLNLGKDVVDEVGSSVWKQNDGGFCTYVTAGTGNKEEIIILFWTKIQESP